MSKSREKMERAAYMRRIHERLLAKVDHHQGFEGRMKDASKLMDKKLGSGWREEAKVDGIEFVDVEDTDMGGRLDSCCDMADKVGDEEGLGPAPDKPEPEPKAGGDKKEMVKRLLELLFDS